jgi:hypothetical protein
MKITFAIWQGSILKGHSLTADSMAEIKQTIKDLNSAGIKPEFSAFISKVEAN